MAPSIHTALGTALHQAEKWDSVERTATEKATPPAKHTPAVRAIDPTVVVAITAGCRDSDPLLAAAIVVAATTGVRRGELCGLRWGDLDLELGRMSVRRAVKYGPDRKSIVGPTKTHRERTIALDAGTVAVLREHRHAPASGPPRSASH